MRHVSVISVAAVVCLSLSLVFTAPGMNSPALAQTPAPQALSMVISATDSHGDPLPGIGKDQVSVFDGKDQLQILGVQSASALPLQVGFVLLASKAKFDQEQAATIALAQKILRPGVDEAFVVTAGGDKQWTDSHIAWLRDANSVTEAVHGLDKNTGLPDLFSYQLHNDQAGLGRMSTQTYNLGTGFSVYDVIWLMMKNDPRPARRVVVMFSSGSAHSPGMNEQFAHHGNMGTSSSRSGRNSEQVTNSTEAAHNRVIGAAQSLGVSFFTIGIDDQLTSADIGRNKVGTDYMPAHSGGNDGSARAYDQNMDRAMEVQYMAGRDNVNRIADETGGRPYWTTKKNFPDAVVGIAAEISAQYVVNFAPPAAGADDPGPVKVQVSGAAHVSAPRALGTASQ